MDDYSMRRSGSVGHEVLLDGQVIAWTVDGWWAAVIVALLNGAEGFDSSVPATRRGSAALANGETQSPTPRYP